MPRGRGPLAREALATATEVGYTYGAELAARTVERATESRAPQGDIA